MNNDVRRLRMLSDYLTSEALCDALADMNLGSRHIPDMLANLPTARLFGRAKTLRLRRLRENENPDGIYRALESYEEIGINDVIVVQADMECAYFGELNAILAKHQGAAGAIIGGLTRDDEATTRMNFPVFSQGTTPRDCKGKLTLESTGYPVMVGNVSVAQNDLVFADPGGVVVIPSLVENEVIRQAVEAISKEANIRRTLLGSTIQEAIALHGAF